MGVLFRICQTMQEQQPDAGDDEERSDGRETDKARTSLIELLARPIGHGKSDGNPAAIYDGTNVGKARNTTLSSSDW